MTFREQYDRMKRWYGRFQQLDQGRVHDQRADEYLDIVHTFFQNCYHLKDWLRSDTAIHQSVRDAVEPHVNASRELRMCADICNGGKHAVLTSRRSGDNPVTGAKRHSLAIGGNSV